MTPPASGFMADSSMPGTLSLRVTARVAPDLWQLRLRRSDPRQHKAVGEALGGILPEALAIAELPRGAALWTGPGEWMLEGDFGAAAPLVEPAAMGPWLLLRIGSGLVRHDLEGSACEILLSKGCGIDLHPDGFPPGRCVRTLFAGMALVIARFGLDRFSLYCELSLAGHLRGWLEEACAEFGTDWEEAR
jgi:sarcosine oxidase, subunit gamma